MNSPRPLARGRSRPQARPPRLGGGTAALQWLAMVLLGLGMTGLQPNLLLGGMVIGLGALTTLKLWEARSLGEHRLVSLLQLVCAGLVAAMRPELGPSLLQAAVIVLALAGLLALELGEGLGWRLLLRRSAQVLAAALPLALVLFLLVPRLGPFSALPSQRGSAASIGLSDSLEPGSISELVDNPSPAARVAFPGGQPPAIDRRYWRVLVHDRFDGQRWSGSTLPPADRNDRRAIAAGEPPAAPGGASQLWLNEPSGLPAVPWSGRGRPLSRELLADAGGELLHRGSSDQRRVYTIADDDSANPWQRRPPGPGDLALPRGRNPRLEALAARWATLPAAAQRLDAARSWFRSQNFSYSASPGTLPERAPLDAFLFERRKGFCGHYASSFTALMRAAGVPARVVSGYRGGTWVQPIGGHGYLDLRQSDAHAWSEVWLPGVGWRQVDPSLWIASGGPGPGQGRAHAGAMEWLQQQWWGLDISWTQLWLGYDRQSQQALLQRLLGEHLQWLGVLVLVAVGLCLAAALAVLSWLQGRSQGDAPRRALEAILRQLARRGLEPEPGETLPVFAGRVQRRWPDLAPELEPFVALYQEHRYGLAPPPGRAGRELQRGRRRLSRRLQRLPH
ncbi:MAG: DUF3488 and transglutaminase-like domain-containing protein [Cyanobacteria bacterium]|nr:DUF3488 and transglutaminase-like domain-containing protein [Cyanobacteriota bacterium]